jgi:type IX secretion system PorP/SprF family membrane protein
MNYNYLKKLISALCLSIIAFAGFAQQLPLNDLYYENRYLFNPANAGDQGYLVGFLNHRRQWVGLEGAPVTNTLSVHSPLGKGNIGLGGTISSDRTDLYQRITGSFTYSHRFNFSEKIVHSIAFGASLGFVDNKINLGSAVVDDNSDPLLQGGNAISGTAFNIDFGLRYNLKGLEFGFAIPQLFETQISYAAASQDARKFTLRRAMVGYLGYKFKIKDKWFIQPSVLLRNSAKATQIDGNLNLSYKDIIWLGATYRTSGGIIPSLGFKVADQFTVAYAYEFAGSSGISSRGNGTHEIMAGFRLSGNKNKNAELEKAIEDLKNNQLSMIEQLDSLKAEQAKLKESDAAQNGKIDNHQQRIEKLEKDINDLNRKIETQKPAQVDTNQVKDMLKRLIKGEDGSYKSVELEKGYYVVIESFKTVKNADKAIAAWDKKSVKAIIVHNEKRGWYYVYSERFDALDPALKEMKKVRASGLQDKAWVHIYK